VRIAEFPKETVIYQKGRHLVRGLQGCKFVAVCDETDHFNFVCSDCKVTAEIQAMRLTNYYGFPELYIDLSCPNCGVLGMRKIWLGAFLWKRK
jgi:hypothetical protein